MTEDAGGRSGRRSALAIGVIVAWRPAPAPVPRGNADLLHRAVGMGAVGHALQHPDPDDRVHDEVGAFAPAREPADASVHVDIELVPLAVLAVVAAVARSRIRAARRPRRLEALLDRAALHHRLHSAGADAGAAGGVEHLPFAPPEIELPILRGRAI